LKNPAAVKRLIVKKFRYDSLIFCGVIKKDFGRGQKLPPGPNRVVEQGV